MVSNKKNVARTTVVRSTLLVAISLAAVGLFVTCGCQSSAPQSTAAAQSGTVGQTSKAPTASAAAPSIPKEYSEKMKERPGIVPNAR